MEPVVSAIVSAYNSERFIEGCLRDLLDQTLGDRLEIIVIDSGSGENEGAVVKRFQETHGNILYIRTPQRETVYQAWNRGALASGGKYLVNANTDDRLRRDAYEVMAGELEANPDIALVYGDILITGYENQTFDSHIRTGYCLRPDWTPGIMLTGCHMGPQPMWRRALHETIGYFDENLKSAGDYEFWCRIAEKYRMKHIPDFLGLYLHNPRGVANSNTALSIEETRRIKEQYRNRLPAASGSFIPACYYDKPLAEHRHVNIGLVGVDGTDLTRRALEALLMRTDYPHVVTVADIGSGDDIRRYLLEQKRRGIVKHLLLLDRNVSRAEASRQARRAEPGAGIYLELETGVVIRRKGWLADMMDALKRAGSPAAASVRRRIFPRDLLLRMFRKGRFGFSGDLSFRIL